MEIWNCKKGKYHKNGRGFDGLDFFVVKIHLVEPILYKEFLKKTEKTSI